MKFHIYFNWLPTLSEYEDYLCKKEQDELVDWRPKWYPHLEFVNAVEEHINEWEFYPYGGQFRLTKLKNFGYSTDKNSPKINHLQHEYQHQSNSNSNSNTVTHEKNVNANVEFDSNKAFFIRAKLDCDITFAEQFELDNFPLDCQDLTCMIQERTTGGIQCKILPELRANNFASIDQTYAVINEWDLVNSILEFDLKKGRTSQCYATMELRLKLQRRMATSVIFEFSVT